MGWNFTFLVVLASAFPVQLLSPSDGPKRLWYWNENYGKTEEQFPEGLWK
ncbi:MAG: hypothetical protein OEZ29_02645 [Candidatus Bathyarchaeota archaeon]|nr:hypothetical protein [Candidatus Bathyarchaeota archaeon]